MGERQIRGNRDRNEGQEKKTEKKGMNRKNNNSLESRDSTDAIEILSASTFPPLEAPPPPPPPPSSPLP